jgi:hypothetical protein
MATLCSRRCDRSASKAVRCHDSDRGASVTAVTLARACTGFALLQPTVGPTVRSTHRLQGTDSLAVECDGALIALDCVEPTRAHPVPSAHRKNLCGARETLRG